MREYKINDTQEAYASSRDIAGMASALYHGHKHHELPPDLEKNIYTHHSAGVANFLQQQKFSVVISLEESLNREFKTELEKHNITYLHLPMRGSYDKNIQFPVHSHEVLDQLYQKICQLNCSVVLHCMGGMGRTGTHLAALILRRKIENLLNEKLITNKALIQHAYTMPMTLLPSERIYSNIHEMNEGNHTVPCTQVVADTVNQLRQIELMRGNKAHFAVETAQQIQALCKYQAYLVNKYLQYASMRML